MIKFDGNIVQFGFGAVGKSFYEKVRMEIKFNQYKYFVITMDKSEFQDYVNLGGIVSNFITQEVRRDNFAEIFAKYLNEGDLLIDFADTVGTRDICEWCAERNIMYINTGETDWPDHWYSIFEENELKNDLKRKYAGSKSKNLYPIVLHHGNNPGLVSHFVKAAIEYVADTQFKKNRKLHGLIKEGKFNLAAKELGLKAVHVNDIDLQKVKGDYRDNVLYNTWCVDSFWFEMLSEATADIGTHESEVSYPCNLVDITKGYVEFEKLAVDVKCRTYYPGGRFEGFLVPHEETVSIAKNLEVYENGKVIYRPTVMFIYKPCEYAEKYILQAKVNDYPVPNPDKPKDMSCADGDTIIRGYVYPKNYEILYKENIASGTEYVGVLLMGDKFNPVWVGNRVELSYLYKNKRNSFWQTPTITPVAMSALSAICWMLKNKNKGGIYFPDDILDYRQIIKTAEKYISKTIYKTFTQEELEQEMKIDFSDLQMRDVLYE